MELINELGNNNVSDNPHQLPSLKLEKFLYYEYQCNGIHYLEFLFLPGTSGPNLEKFIPELLLPGIKPRTSASSIHSANRWIDKVVSLELGAE